MFWKAWAWVFNQMGMVARDLGDGGGWWWARILRYWLVSEGQKEQVPGWRTVRRGKQQCFPLLKVTNGIQGYNTSMYPRSGKTVLPSVLWWWRWTMVITLSTTISLSVMLESVQNEFQTEERFIFYLIDPWAQLEIHWYSTDFTILHFPSAGTLCCRYQ